MQNAGLIWNLELQKKYILQASFTFNGKKIVRLSNSLFVDKKTDEMTIKKLLTFS